MPKLPALRRVVSISFPVLLALILAACSAGTKTPAPTAAAVSVPTVAAITPTAAARPATAAPTAAPAATTAPTRAATAAPAVSTAPTAAPAATSAPAATAAPTAAPTPDLQSQVPNLQSIRLTLEPVVSGLAWPVYATGAGDGSGRLFVLEKAGTIRIVQNGKLLGQAFLAIGDRVKSSGLEQGLLGLAFPPDYKSSGLFYVYYIDTNGDTQVSRFKVTPDPNVADAGSEFKVLHVKQPFPNHNGGMITFGPDGMLYVGLGDGGSEGDPQKNGQSAATPLAKILRIDVRDPAVPYKVPGDNPWASQPYNGGKMVPEAWQAGLRNPWRFSFDRQTGDLWIADVGQNVYEEVDYVKAGANKMPPGGLNFGWSIMEGTHCFPDAAQCNRQGLTLPILDYSHAAGGCSITGGYVYRGKGSPALDGVYLYGDWCSGKIWGLAPDGRGGWAGQLLSQTQFNITSFGEDEAGEVYLVDQKGGVYRVKG